MLIKDIAVRSKDDCFEVSAAVQVENGNRPVCRIWYQVPAEFQNSVLNRGDAWLAALLLPAMKLKERLLIEAPVSKQLLHNISKIQDIYLNWVQGLKRIEVEVSESVPSEPGDGWIGSFFSGGVDSFYTLLKNERDTSEENPTITHLIFVDGFDIKVDNQDFANKVYERISYIAECKGKTKVRIKTNLRAFTDTLVNWNFYHGAALASVSLLCGGVFKRVLIPATHSYQDLRPYGSHPLLDPLWSTENTELVHDGCEITRTEKVTEWICKSELALETLRVCWKNPKDIYNCSVCEKCLRTMIALSSGGALQRCGTFQTLDLKRVEKMRFKNLGYLKYASDNLKSIPQNTDFNRSLRWALKKAVQRNRIRLALNVLLGKRI